MLVRLVQTLMGRDYKHVRQRKRARSKPRWITFGHQDAVNAVGDVPLLSFDFVDYLRRYGQKDFNRIHFELGSWAEQIVPRIELIDFHLRLLDDRLFIFQRD
jgi:hypothetical protein